MQMVNDEMQKGKNQQWTEDKYYVKKEKGVITDTLKRHVFGSNVFCNEDDCKDTQLIKRMLSPGCQLIPTMSLRHKIL